MVNLNNTVFARNLQRRWAEAEQRKLDVERKEALKQQQFQQMSGGIQQVLDEKERERRYQLERQDKARQRTIELAQAHGELAGMSGKVAPKYSDPGVQKFADVAELRGALQKKKEEEAAEAKKGEAKTARHARLDEIGLRSEARRGEIELAAKLRKRDQAALDRLKSGRPMPPKEVAALAAVIRRRPLGQAKAWMEKAGWSEGTDMMSMLASLDKKGNEDKREMMMMGIEAKVASNAIADPEALDKFSKKLAKAKTLQDIKRIKQELDLPQFRFDAPQTLEMKPWERAGALGQGPLAPSSPGSYGLSPEEQQYAVETGMLPGGAPAGGPPPPTYDATGGTGRVDPEATKSIAERLYSGR